MASPVSAALSYAPQLLALLGVWALAVISPGPDFVATSRYAVARSRRDGVLVGLGVTCGIAVWVTLSLAGLGFLIARANWLLIVLRLAGAAYLMWLGAQALWGAIRPPAAAPDVESAPPTHSLFGARLGSAPSWLIGFLTNIGNPKALAFFSSIFALLLPTHPSLWLDGAILLGMLIIAAGWFSLVALLFSLPPVTRFYRRSQRWLDALTGGVFLALGARLAISG